ncbi:MAG: hypothetical protein HYW34_02080 [Candidatus Brennerbacteria bacterium]|nr:hypothetical protein [Candidatus Brennerbacteria bacterium]
MNIQPPEISPVSEGSPAKRASETEGVRSGGRGKFELGGYDEQKFLDKLKTLSK